MINLWDNPEVEAVACQRDDLYNGNRFYSFYGIGHGRLGHSKSLERSDVACRAYNKTDTIRCSYIFGETLLETTHKFGQCPWKTLDRRLRR